MLSLRKPVRISKDFWFFTIKAVILGNLIIFGLILTVAFTTYYLESEVAKGLSFQVLVGKHYLNLNPINYNFVSFINFIVYGNYVRIDRKFTQDIFDEAAVEKVTSDSLLPRLKTLISTEDYNLLRQLQQGDPCELYDNKTIVDQQEKSICLNHSSSRNGYLPFIQSEHTFIRNFRESDIVKLREKQLNISKKAMFDGIFGKYLVEERFLKLIFVHKSLTKLYVTELMKIFKHRLTRAYYKIERTLWTLLVIVWTVAPPAVLTYILRLNRLNRRDYMATLETMRNLEPKVVCKNMPVFRRILTIDSHDHLKI